MYTQIRKAGIKQFLAVIIILPVVMFIFSYIRFLMTDYYVAADIIFCAVLFFIGYVVFIKYTSVFTYRIDNDILYIERKLGRQIKNFEIEINRIKKLTQNKQAANLPKKSPNMCVSVFSKKDVYYLLYRKNKTTMGIIFEPDENLLNYIKSGGSHD